MNLSSVDLNLFVALDAVLETRSATLAAARLHVTQSAVSNSLRRLRELLGDPLLVRTRRGLAPTPKALELREALRSGLDSLRAVLEGAEAFDPRKTARELRLACIDLHAAVLLPALLPLLRARAPRVSLVVRSLEQVFVGDGLGTGEVDLYVGDPRTHPPSWRSEPLLSDSQVCVLRGTHPAARRKLTLDAFTALPLIQVRVIPTRGNELEDALARVGRVSHPVLTVPHFSVVPSLLAASDCAAVLPARLVARFAPAFGLAVRPLPLELPPSHISVHWHRRVDSDPAVRFLRGLLQEAAQVK